MLRRSPGFAWTAVLTLALGIGANTAIFSVVNKVLLEPLPYPDPDRLVQLMSESAVGSQPVVSIPKYIIWRKLTGVFQSIAAYDAGGPAVSLTGGEYPEAVRAARVSADYFQLFGARLEIGRTFSAQEDRPGGPRVAVISHRLWRARFHGDPALVGRNISLETEPYKVVGVLAADFHMRPGGRNLAAAAGRPIVRRSRWPGPRGGAPGARHHARTGQQVDVPNHRDVFVPVPLVRFSTGKISPPYPCATP